MSDYLLIIHTLRKFDLITEEQAETVINEVQEDLDRGLAFRDEFRANQSWWDRIYAHPNAWRDAWREQQEAEA